MVVSNPAAGAWPSCGSFCCSAPHKLQLQKPQHTHAQRPRLARLMVEGSGSAAVATAANESRSGLDALRWPSRWCYYNFWLQEPTIVVLIQQLQNPIVCLVMPSPRHTANHPDLTN